MLSKIKSPSLIERPSAQLGHANNNTNNNNNNNNIDQSERPQSSEELDDNDERQLEGEQTDATDLIIEREPETEKKQNEPESELHLENEPDLSGAQRQAINDNNNNINENNNNNNNNLNNLNENSNRSLMLQHRVALQQQQQQQRRTGKRSQNELIDIIEVSRKRRLSKDSADSLTSFIRWSFSHLDELPTGRLAKVQTIRRPRQIKSERDDGDHDEEIRHEELDESENLTIDDRDDDQSEMLRVVGTERVLRNRAGRHAANEQQVDVELDEGPDELEEEMTPIKRARSQSRSPEPRAKLLSGTSIDLSDVHSQGRKSNSFQQEANTNGIGHNQQRNIKSLDHIANQLSRVGQLNLSNSGGGDELADDRRSSNGLALQLQQFLQQQQQQQQQQHNSVLDELMLNPDGATSPGGGQPQASQQQQIALAAAIHRALLGQGASNSTPGATTNGRSEMKPTNGAGTQQHLAISPGGFIGDSLNRQQQQRPRAYNTRGLAQAAANLASNRLQQQQLAISNRVAMIQQQQQHHQQQQQQQRHAQAAAALSVLANGANPVALHHFAAAAAAAAASNQPGNGAGGGGGLPHHHQPTSGASAAAAAAAAALQRQHQHQQQQQRHQHQAAFQLPPASGQPNAISLAALANQTEFKCDTCPSSFDDRHRLMQHQSIHLELKKDWFTETPVDEVMKIFNRRRGEFLCNLCNLRFEATLDYDQHNHQVHGPRPYCCQFCGNGTRTFKCWRQYLNHLYDHRYIFSCTIGDCDFTVNRRDSLRFHIFRFHLNCQLPQNQLVTPTNGLGQPNNTKFSSSAQLSPYNLSQNGAGGGGGGGGGFGRDVDSFHFGNLQAGQQKWSHLNDLDMEDVDEADEDTENEMNVAD